MEFEGPCPLNKEDFVQEVTAEIKLKRAIRMTGENCWERKEITNAKENARYILEMTSKNIKDLGTA